jgi:hypothetical protein
VNVTLTVAIERKSPQLAGFVVVPAAAVAAWELTTTTTIEGTIDGVALGRRSLARWDADRWFIELRRDTLAALGKDAGDTVTLTIHVASTALPPELEALLAAEPDALSRWEALTPAQRRMLREEVLAARTPAGRESRARRDLLPPPQAPRPPVDGLPATPVTLRVRICAHHLPGRVCGPYTEIHVGLPRSGGHAPADFVPADLPTVEWETDITVRAKDGVPAFGGPAVNGPPRERFLYLTWLGRKDGQPLTMFRRAKLRLDAVPVDVLSAAVRSGVLVGELGLTACDGMPVCASVVPPAITWSAGS